jgi:hypothetical protein
MVFVERARGIAQVSLDIPPVSVIFSFIFNSKISKYVWDIYPGVFGQYPVSEQYPIPVRWKSEVSALPRSALHALGNCMCGSGSWCITFGGLQSYG